MVQMISISIDGLSKYEESAIEYELTRSLVHILKMTAEMSVTYRDISIRVNDNTYKVSSNGQVRRG